MKNNRLVYVLIAILALWLTVLTLNQKTYVAKKDETAVINKYDVSGFTTDFTKVIEEVDSSVVSISTESSLLSGFIYSQVDDKVYIITAYHGVDNANNINVVFDNALSVSGQLVGKDIYSDIAIISANLPYQVKPVTIGNSSLLSKGEMVLTIGTPLTSEFKGSVSLGMVSSPLQCIENTIIFDEMNYKYYSNYIELSSNLVSGFSGSPLINMNGEVVGVTTMAYKEQICLAVPINEVCLVADQIIENGNAHKTKLGIKGEYLQNLESYTKTYLNIALDAVDGLYLETIRTDSIASIAGLRLGDIIVSINGVNLKSYDDYLKVVYSDTNTFEFKILRDNQEITLVGLIND